MALTALPLWEHQREALRDLKAELSSAGRATNVMACGTGKTRVGAEVAGLVSPSGPVLIVVPTLDLVAQTLTGWLEALGREALGHIIAVCGDREVMDRDAAEDLTALHIEVTSDSDRLAELLRTRRGRSTVAITYQSLPKLVAAHRIRGVQPWKLVIVDEAHRSAGLKDRQWSVIHDDVLVPASKRLYMTATPRLVSVREGDLSEVVSMDDEKVFGRVAHRLSFAKARERKLLADYRVIVSVVTDEEMHRLATERDSSTFLQLGPSAVSAPMLARQVAVLRAAREFKVQRMLTYHRRVTDARWFSQTLPGADALLGLADTLTTGFVHGSQRRVQRRKELAKLSDDRLGRVVISNARVLSEGYDAPAVDGVAFIDARKSTIDTVQAVGRALRLGGQKDKTAYILVPVLMEPGQDPVSALQGSAYAPVWQVVSALAAHDEALGADLEARRRALGRSYLPSGETLTELPEWLQINGVPVPHRFAEAITVQAVRSTTASWEEHLGAAASYADEHGDLLVRTDFVTDSGLALGQWIRWARQLHNDGNLSPARHAQLEEIGMVWDVLDENFARRLEIAAKYRAEQGNLRVPRSYVTAGPDPFRLGAWINGLRSRREQLSSRQREALDELGMVWAVFAEDWKQGIDAARAYRQQHGHLRVPRDHVEESTDGSEGFTLGLWLAGKREQRKKMTPERIAELDALGIAWRPYEDTWRRNFEAAQAYHARHGNLDMPARYIEQLPEGEVDLGAWLYRQHAEIEAGTLSAERSAALESLGVKLIRAHERAWQHALTFARLYHKKFGNLNVQARQTITDADGEEFKLGAWISKTRDRRIRGTLAADRITELDKLGMIWDVNEAAWLDHFAAAKAYYRTHRHLMIPFKYVTKPPEELRLGAWISRQRADFKKGKLSMGRIKDLTKIGMRWPT
ncbi:Helicase associated domain protein [Streptomyces sp. NBC_01433]|uniref:DEAD/DEAH box helicase n=1 Tax=Streptomyces sp. NBC_01433 TaxID=2903864 RepID=UPI00224FEDA9|nr:DEAD/DEAH box helicase [Streptomyces sp. NBC_01433]MCX4681528.1 Helicase associated domain protein [Streptomyces sp. NBC_01433]